MNLSAEDKLLLAAARLDPSAEEIHFMKELISAVNDWKYFTFNAIRNSIAPLAYKNLSLVQHNNEVPLKTLAKFKQTYLVSLSRNAVLYEQFKNAVNAFSLQGISFIALKGIFLAESIYKDIGLRQMSDVDLLVKNADAIPCRDILMGMGYSTLERVKTSFIRRQHDVKHLPPMMLNGVSIEIHQKVLPDDFDYQVSIENYWKHAIPATIYGVKTLVLSPNDLLQHLCIHFDQHFRNGMIQLYSFCDIAEVLKKYQNEIDWTSFEESCDKCNCSKNVFSLLCLADKYFNAPLPEKIKQSAFQYIDKATERLFIHYLKGNRKEISNEISNINIKSLGKINGFKNKLKYLTGDIFPSLAFMSKRYHIKHKGLIYWYYLVRIKSGITALFTHLLKRKENS